MKYGPLGRSRVTVSKICLGTMNFGPYASESEAHEIMSVAHELGINYFDTANSYGSAEREHHSEHIIGDWFAEEPSRREKTVLATKLFEGDQNWPNRSGLSALNIIRTCEASLRRLRTDYIDVLQMHHVDRAAPWDEIWEAFDTLRSQGKIIYSGSSNFAAWHLMDAQAHAKARQSIGLISEQSLYNLTARTIELEVLPASRHLGIGIVAWSPLAGGLLARSLDSAPTGTRSHGQGDEKMLRYRDQLIAHRRFSERLGVAAAELALAWVLAQNGVAAAISGPRTVEQLRSSAMAADISLDEAALGALDDIWPGPGGEAPEAYAW